ncbi:regulatory helix-turn-helix protein, lysR family [Dethiosulfatibacter aminovorans DSM 17477]|uniref:Regulatory helix-turn-helix protein, lysR family n=1 Tax=Dethiosulfatibacter aminovorans DSM 17477 TaxID=1121476 RepID=A0A1M6M1X9_9FIRM|nr:LysR family transcriptional regulator [Dethiosulfatibacter aminovorans]SHJ77435.1 regulatory helix-turn-helix protein, lysR family [Dethiosulfatibacter aminovorans DSM 17477]
MINEKQINYLLTVAEEKNITAASRKLFISQPALSRMILDLEHALGTKLFIRERGNLQLTQAGEIYLRGCRDVLAISTSVTKKIKDLKDSKSGRITLGVTSITGEFLLPSILDPFEQAFPNVELVLMEERMSDLQEKVISGKADMALVYQTDEQELDYQLVLENPVYVQIPPSFYNERCKGKKENERIRLLPEDFSDQQIILLKKGRGLRVLADQFLKQFQITPSKVIETDNIHLASSLVRLNKGFTLVPSIIAYHFSQNNNLSFYGEIEKYPMERNLYCCYRKSRYLTKAEVFLMDLIPRMVPQNIT